jgi:hypothetical protein
VCPPPLNQQETKKKAEKPTLARSDSDTAKKQQSKNEIQKCRPLCTRKTLFSVIIIIPQNVSALSLSAGPLAPVINQIVINIRHSWPVGANQSFVPP